MGRLEDMLEQIDKIEEKWTGPIESFHKNLKSRFQRFNNKQDTEIIVLFGPKRSGKKRIV